MTLFVAKTPTWAHSLGELISQRLPGPKSVSNYSRTSVWESPMVGVQGNHRSIDRVKIKGSNCWFLGRISKVEISGLSLKRLDEIFFLSPR
jgi:hypothetical protein